MMKIKSLILTLTAVFTTSGALADGEKTDPRVGENTSCVKCIDIVDQSRNLNPDKIVWESDKSACQNYAEDGSCSVVDESNEIDSNVK